MSILRGVASAAMVTTMIAAAVACGSSSTDSTTTPGAPAPAPPSVPTTQTGGSSGIVTQTIDASPTEQDSGPKCEELGTLEGLGIEASYDNGDQWFWGPLANHAATRLGVLGSASSASTEGQTVQLGTGLEANYATCTHCMAIAVGCVADDCSKATWFFAESGTARFDQVATSPGETFSGRFDDVTLVQVTVDFANGYQSAVVANGGCFHVTAATFSATTYDVASVPPDDAGTSSDATTTDASSTDGGGGGGGGTGGNNGNHGGGRNGDFGGNKIQDAGSG